ncbi:hypothetical protein SPAR115_1701 [Streptococcus pneumoniae GA52306]|nr:hypothetical protein SPAR115_1701 [Streptococcus pneumoniae GA52306]
MLRPQQVPQRLNRPQPVLQPQQAHQLLNRHRQVRQLQRQPVRRPQQVLVPRLQ